MNRLSNLSGGSVAVKTTSARISTMPVGVQDRENACIQLRISRPRRRTRYIESA